MSEKIYEELSTSILEGDSATSTEMTQKGLDEGVSARDILQKGLIVGMDEVGVRFKRGDMFVPEVLMSAEAMSEAMKLLRPLLTDSDTEMAGKILMGTVEGDLHEGTPTRHRGHVRHADDHHARHGPHHQGHRGSRPA